MFGGIRTLLYHIPLCVNYCCVIYGCYGIKLVNVYVEFDSTLSTLGVNKEQMIAA